MSSYGVLDLSNYKFQGWEDNTHYTAYPGFPRYLLSLSTGHSFNRSIDGILSALFLFHQLILISDGEMHMYLDLSQPLPGFGPAPRATKPHLPTKGRDRDLGYQCDNVSYVLKFINPVARLDGFLSIMVSVSMLRFDPGFSLSFIPTIGTGCHIK